MLVFLINLNRRPDRLAEMSGRLKDLGLAFERVEAVDGRDLPPPSGEQSLSNLERACHLSHRECWRRLVASGEPQALVLEDDLVFSSRFAEIVNDPHLLPAGADIIRLETYDQAWEVISLLSKVTPSRLRIHRIYSQPQGAAAYILRRPAAERLLSVDVSRQIEADFVISPTRGLKVLQVVPAPAIQGAKLFRGRVPPTMRSDIGDDRKWNHENSQAKTTKPLTPVRLLGRIRLALARRTLAARLFVQGRQYALIPPDTANIGEVTSRHD